MADQWMQVWARTRLQKQLSRRKTPTVSIYLCCLLLHRVLLRKLKTYSWMKLWRIFKSHKLIPARICLRIENTRIEKSKIYMYRIKTSKIIWCIYRLYFIILFLWHTNKWPMYVPILFQAAFAILNIFDFAAKRVYILSIAGLNSHVQAVLRLNVGFLHPFNHVRLKIVPMLTDHKTEPYSVYRFFTESDWSPQTNQFANSRQIYGHETGKLRIGRKLSICTKCKIQKFQLNLQLPLQFPHRVNWCSDKIGE